MAFGFVRAITIDHTKVPAGLTDFPVLISGTLSYLATVGNGGNVQNASGFDVGFYSDAALTTKLDWETELYTAASGLVVYWVRIPSVSSSVDTVIYLAYGDAAITTDQSNKTGVWDSGFVGVWHMGETSGTTNANSTSNSGLDATKVSSVLPSPTAGKLAGAQSYDNSGNAASKTAGNSLLNPTTITLSAWINPATLSHHGNFCFKDGNSGYRVRVDASSGTLEFLDLGGTNVLASATPVSAGVFAHVVLVGGASGLKIYLNGALDNSNGTAYSIAGGNSDELYLGLESSLIGEAWEGILEEARISSVARSADWILAEFNNQSSPATFYSVSSPLGGGLSVSFRVRPTRPRPFAPGLAR